MLKNTKEDTTFASILADGKIHVTVPEGTPGSVIRSYETSDKKQGTKTEMVYSELIGKITKVDFHEGDFGNQFQVEVRDESTNDKPVVLSLGTASNFGEDFMKKILNVNMEQNVRIVPFSFTDEKTKKSKKGVTIYQMNENGKGSHKIQNYFYDEVKKENTNGYPVPKKLKKPLTKDQWKLYFAEAREFLVQTITEHFKLGENNSKMQDEVDNF